MKEKVKQYIERYHMLRTGDNVVVGLSGGADSVCLFLLLSEMSKEIGFSLTAVHVEHGIRGEESRRDADFVEMLCREREIKLLQYTVDVPQYRAQIGGSLEEAARLLRYDCYRRACLSCGADRIALAHQADDCAETMLFHLSRGTGIRGMSGIRPVSEHMYPGAEKRTVIRPLLCVTHAEIVSWLDKRGQRYCLDSTNADVAYARNRIRQRVVPELTRINAQTVVHMQHLSEQLSEVCDFMDAAAWEAGQGAFTVEECTEESREAAAKITIFCARFLAMEDVLQKHLLLQLIGMAAGERRNITSTHVEQVMGLMTAQVGASVSLPHGITAKKTYDTVQLCGETHDPAPFTAQSLVIPGVTVMEGGLTFATEILEDFDFSQKIPRKSYTKWFDYDKIHSVAQLRGRLPGDYLITDANGSRKKLTRYLIDEKVPLAERDRICLVADGSHILWVIGYRISEAYKVTKDTERILRIHVSYGEEA